MAVRAILVRIGAAPVDGAANDGLIETLSVLSSTRSRNKRVRVNGLSRDAALQKLGVTA